MSIQQSITDAANRYGVPPEIAIAVAKQESNFNQSARGSSGEVGMFQIMPITARGLGIDPYILNENIEGGVRYLKEQYDRFGSWNLALAAYNAGPSRVQAGFIPQEYVDSVLRWAGWSDKDPVFSTTVYATAPGTWQRGTWAGIPSWALWGLAALLGLAVARR